MDHLPLPSDPILPLIEVPYLCNELYDVTIPFLEYPRRKGRPWMTPNADEIPYRTREKLFPTETRDLESFFQTWLFFGLLAELLAGLYNQESFLSKSERDGSHIISTKQLQSLTEQRFELIKSLEKAAQKEVYLHAVKCIDITMIVLPAAPPEFDPAVKNSILSLAEFLGSAVDKNHLGVFPDAARCRTPYTNFFYTKEMESAMVSANWCPNDITRTTDKFRSTQLLYFLSKMKKPSSIASHRDCSTNFCLAHSISLSEHKACHFEACTNKNTCEEIYIDHRSVVDILHSGALPLLRITEEDDSGKVTVDLSSSGSDGFSYVAISHVWADGLGNPSANSLPHCQLARLGRMLDPFSEAGTRPLVWLDTLCCPVNPEGKNLALLQMRHTYAEAKKTLILDSSLYNFEGRNLSAAELHARILTCGWMLRLWTLQEVALAKDPWVQFKDGPISLVTIYGRLMQLHNENLNYRRLTQDMFHDSRLLNLASYYFPKDVPDLSLLDRALSHRKTTVASDEALCIATLMNLDISQILPLSGDDRMCKVWDLLAAANSGSLPRNMIFLEGPKLSCRGHRWAPSTLLPPSERFLNVQTRWIRWRGPQGKPTSKGLMAEYPSYRLCRYLGPSHSPVWDILLTIPQHRFVFKDQTRGGWCQLYYKSTSVQLESNPPSSNITGPPFADLVADGDKAVILSEEFPPNPSEDIFKEGILVTITDEKSGMLHADLGEAVVFTPLPPRQVLVYDAAEQLMRKFRSWELEDAKGLEVAEQMSEERLSRLRSRCKEMTRELVAEEPGLGDAVVDMIGKNGEGCFLWVLVATWFAHVGEVERVGQGKMWCVD